MMVGTTLRLATKVLGKLRVPLVLVNGNADVVTAINDDLLISNVEFTNAVLLAVEVNFEMKIWIRNKIRHYENSIRFFHAVKVTILYSRKEHADTSCSFSCSILWSSAHR